MFSKFLLATSSVLLLATSTAFAAKEKEPELPADLVTNQKIIAKRTWNQAVKEAKAKNLPILIRFSDTKFCVPCEKWDKAVFSKANVKKHCGAYCVVLDYEGISTSPTAESKEMANKYGLKGIPRVMLVDAEGKIIADGGTAKNTPEAFLRWLKDSKK